MTITQAFCDGGVMGASRSYEGGAWAWCHIDALHKLVASASGLVFPTKTVPSITNNYTEYVAAVRMLEALPENWIGDVWTDSAVTLGRLCDGWATNGLPDALVERGIAAMNRLGGTFWHLCDGHPTQAQLREGYGKRGNPVSIWNVWCDEECARVMREYRTTAKGGSYGSKASEAALSDMSA